MNNHNNNNNITSKRLNMNASHSKQKKGKIMFLCAFNFC